MTSFTPVGQLLERQPVDRYRDWLLVTPVLDDSLLHAPPRRVWCTDHAIAAAYRKAGHDVIEGLEAPGNVQGALLFWPKSHALGVWWVRTLCTTLKVTTPLHIVGEHQGGIKRVPKVLEALGLSGERVDNARRCSLFATSTHASCHAESDTEDGWLRFEALDLTLHSHPGVFGHGKLDEGTRLLLEHLPTLSGHVLDVGCGDGIISAWLATRGAAVTATDVNHFALEATRRTLAANGASGEVIASDMLENVSGRFTAIVTNPPFHQERSVDYDPTRRLIEQAPEHIEEGGCFYLVANAFLPYAQILKTHFTQVEVLADNRRFKVYRATNG
ncbi:class I SAM-dependent methyltransferase [Phytohalomonas tamaricis]|uniref:class I SAM-dependent methyltransferase n=1 Tax=Phytohalomonas tamaricis TaxID=2081032 RepID=UPI000D0B29B9|nr:class I SAM-dependent methyltransferase [Phytohalomonas tamaricis]